MKLGRAFRPSAAMVIAWIALTISLGGTAAATGWRQTLISAEPFQAVGAPGAPAFSDGGQGDCVWTNADPSSGQISGLNPVAFYREPTGGVHLVGVAARSGGSGGDGGCGESDLTEDSIVFVLPAGYRPENVEIVGGTRAEVIIVPEEGAVISGVEVPPGSVVSFGGDVVVLDGAEFRAAGDGTAPIADSHAPAEVRSLSELAALAD